MYEHPTLQVAIKEAETVLIEVRRTLYESEVDYSIRTVFAHSTFDVGFGHFRAICYLAATRDDLDSSVRAMFRPLLEAYLRGTWLLLVASDSRIKEINDTPDWDGWPQLRQLMELTDDQMKAEFFTYAKAGLKLAHDFTHCGKQTMLRHWHDDSIIGPEHDPTSLGRIVRLSTVLTGIVASLFLDQAGRHQDSCNLVTLALAPFNDDPDLVDGA